LAPHPDDEIIACAGVIQEAIAQGAQVHIVYLTNGDSNQLAFIVYEKRLTFRKGEFLHMGQVRRQEAIAATSLLGVPQANLTFLGYPDFGTMAIFAAHWGQAKAFKSLFTRVNSVPYQEDFSYGAPYKGESVLADLEKALLQYKPNKIFVSHPADTNADHKAVYLFLQIALSDARNDLPAPCVWPYLVHCAGWPLPRHYHPELELHAPKQFQDSPIPWMTYPLGPGQLDNKYQAILAYKSQTKSSAFYLTAFARKNELFGDYPDIEFSLSSTLGSGGVSKGTTSFIGDSVLYEEAGSEAISNLDHVITGKGHVSYGLSDQSLLIRVNKTKALSNRFGIMLYLFGYSQQVPFSRMPKICIIVRRHKVRVLDAKRIIDAKGIHYTYSKNEFMLAVPLELLGEPDFILSSARTYAGILPIDTVSFRKIQIRR
jgi:LmbE family N-acetylglucosaminyl deacetylase